VVPLVADGDLATIAEVAKDEKGWKVASLADKSLSSELDVVRKAAGSQSEIVIYDLPHSAIKVYGVTQKAAGETSGTAFYTNYPGFNLREAAPAERLLPVLKQDAAELQRKYGEELKRQKVAE
jgi:hypothetical protein